MTGWERLESFLATDRDRRVLRDGIRMVRAVAAQPAMRAFVERELAPGSDADTDIDALIRATGITVHHPAGTEYPATDLAAAGVRATPESLFTHLSATMLTRLAQWLPGVARLA